MRFRVLATDYDGTLAESGHVRDGAWRAIRELKSSGRRVVLVTGRLLDDLEAICPHLDLFDRVVAENGAVIYEPDRRVTRILSEPPSSRFVARLVELAVTPLSVGHVIVATTRENEAMVVATIHEFGLDVQLTYNQDSLMILPTKVDKASGLAVALQDLGELPENAAAIGDAENDLAMMSYCELGVAVGSADSEIRKQADLVMRGTAGTSVVELIAQLLSKDLIVTKKSKNENKPHNA